MKFIKFSATILLGVLLFYSCAAKETPQEKAEPQVSKIEIANPDTAYFASGCFWCTEAVFERVKGVGEVVSGYSGGTKSNPTYKEVARGKTDYAESVRVVYDPEIVTYSELVEIFYGSHDPTQLNRQGPDIGKQYRSAIFYETEKQREIARSWKKKLDKSGKYSDPIVTEITRFRSFYVAEGYHQDYYAKHPDNRYIANVSRPKVEKFEKEFKDMLKEQYKEQVN